jgi:hypothetical protein
LVAGQVTTDQRRFIQMPSNVPPSNGVQHPPPQPLSSQVIQVAIPVTEALYSIGEDAIQKSQQPRPPGQ